MDTLVAVYYDKSVRIYNIPTGKTICVLKHNDHINTVAMFGSYVITAS